MHLLILAWRPMRRDFASGDVRILFVALVLAVVAITSVGFVTDRAERALAQEANRLLGGDVALRSDTPITGALRDAAIAPGLRHADTLEFRSMLRVGEALQLGELRALDGHYPLRGEFQCFALGRVDTVQGRDLPRFGYLQLRYRIRRQVIKARGIFQQRLITSQLDIRNNCRHSLAHAAVRLPIPSR